MHPGLRGLRARIVSWRSLADPSQRLFQLKVAIAGGLLGGFLLSPRLWLSGRFYPQTPVVPFLRPIPYPIDHVVFIVLLLLLVTVAVVRKPAKPRVTLRI